MNQHLSQLSEKSVLFLQGPMGPFFAKLERQLREKGATTFRICFNGGDRIYSVNGSRIDYTGTTAQWRSFIGKLYSEKRIDAIILYGDCRFYHRVAMDVAARSGIRVFVFEEGYIRPNFITLEENGVNAHSAVPRDAEFYRRLEPKPPLENSSAPVRYNFQRWALYAVVYFIFMRVWRYRYRFYQHHRNTDIFHELIYGLRNAIRKIWFARTDKKYTVAITSDLHKKFYFVPLQVQYDFQISRHSPFNAMEDFIRRVLGSFARHAPEHAYLVLKHHPMDRGRLLFYAYIRKLAKRLGVLHRVCVVHDVHLPSCLKNAIGTVTINSTVGIASLFHGTPTIVLGEAMYDIDGMTCKGLPLDRFWTEYKGPDRKLFRQFRNYLIEKTQLEGSFYGGFPFFTR
jgi:capsular polysaccharide export protein